MQEEAMLELIESYLDAAPRSAADAEPVGKFTLFRPRGPWRYYARPRLGLAEPITAADVDVLRARQRELGLPQSIEWMYAAAPSLAAAAEAAGLRVARYPLMILDVAARASVAIPDGYEVRLLAPDDPDFGRAHAVAAVAFGAGGTQIGGEGAAERDARAASGAVEELEFQRRRASAGLSVSAVALDGGGPVAVGTHQPVGAVTEIVGVATLPAARRRGLGAALTAVLVDDAFRRGVTSVFLSAGSDDVARVYERIGFRRIGSVGSAEAS